MTAVTHKFEYEVMAGSASTVMTVPRPTVTTTSPVEDVSWRRLSPIASYIHLFAFGRSAPSTQFSSSVTLTPEPVVELVRPTPRGQLVQRMAEVTLSELGARGRLQTYRLAEISSKAVQFDVEVTPEQWADGAPREIQEAALAVQERFDATVLFDVRRVRARLQ